MQVSCKTHFEEPEGNILFPHCLNNLSAMAIFFYLGSNGKQLKTLEAVLFLDFFSLINSNRNFFLLSLTEIKFKALTGKIDYISALHITFFFFLQY